MRNTDPKPTTYAEWEDLEEERDQLRADRDRLAAELARVRSVMELADKALECSNYAVDHPARTGLRAALAQPQDGTTEGRG